MNTLKHTTTIKILTDSMDIASRSGDLKAYFTLLTLLQREVKILTNLVERRKEVRQELISREAGFLGE